jgi:hypothetical protein
MDLDGITRSELGKPSAQVGLLDEIGGVHGGRARIPATSFGPRDSFGIERSDPSCAN